MSSYYDKSGAPITFLDWAYKLEDAAYRFVELTEIGGVYVSTVWLGLDHSFGKGPLLLFETGVRSDTGFERREYSTLEEAKRGHAEIVESLLRASEQSQKTEDLPP